MLRRYRLEQALQRSLRQRCTASAIRLGDLRRKGGAP